jgi:hypothetical protein
MMKKAVYLFLTLALLASCNQHITDPAGLTARHGHSSVAFNGRLYVISGSERLDYMDWLYDSLKRDILTSADGTSWNAGTPYFWCVGSKALTYNGRIYLSGGMYAVAGSGDPILQPEIWTSADGSTWTFAGSLPSLEGRRDHAFVVHDGKFWIIGGNKGQADLNQPYGPNNIRQSNDVYVSADGSSYTLVPSGSGQRWIPRDGLAAVSFQNKLWILGGAKRFAGEPAAGFDYESLGDVWNTTDGSTWTLVPQGGDSHRWEALGRAFHQVVVLDGALYLIGGIEANVKNGVKRACNDIQKSTDGAYWSKVAEFPGPRYEHTAVVMGHSIYIIGGRNESVSLRDIFVYTP